MLDLPGAVEADPPDTTVAAHYGHIVEEQRALLSGEAFVDLSHRDVVSIAGEDRHALLHALTTQHFENVRPGQIIDGFILSPQGRIEHAFSGVDDGTAFHAHTEPGAGEPLVQFLNSMKFMMRVESRVDTSLAVIGYWERGGTSPLWRFVSRDQLDSVAQSAGQPVGLWAYEALRIEAGIARIGVDTDDLTIPNEIAMDSSDEQLGSFVHLAKGCYRGQETVARVHNLGRPPRRLTRLLLDGSPSHLPEPGATIWHGDRQVGQLGSRAVHHELGPIGLALLKRSTPVDADLIVRDTTEDVAASQEVIVDPEVGLHVRTSQIGKQ